MTRIGRGLYRDRYGYRVIWREQGRAREKRFPPDTPIETLKKYRARQVGQAAQYTEASRTGLARDVVKFLRHRRGLRSFVTERAQLRAWLRRYPRRSRWALTSAHVREAIAAWQGEGYSAQEIRHRVRRLRQVYRVLDGPTAPTPCDGVTLPRLPKPRPVPVPDDLIRQVAVHLRAHEIAKRLRTSKTRARYLVLATTGQRPAQVMRAQPEDVSLEQRIWIVRPAKGDRGTIVALNDDMLNAWTLFRAARAWGPFNQRSFVKTLRRNGWPKGIRPYTLRHSVGMALSAAQVDLGDIQAHMGHGSPTTTRAFYVPGLLRRQQAASAAIEGRLGPAAMFDCHDAVRIEGEATSGGATMRKLDDAGKTRRKLVHASKTA